MNSRVAAAVLAGIGGLMCIGGAVVGDRKAEDVKKPDAVVKPTTVVTTTDIKITDADTAEQLWQKCHALYVKNTSVALREWAKRARAKEWDASGPASEAFMGLSAMARERAFQAWNDRVFKIAGASADGMEDRYDPEQLAGYAERQAAAGDQLLEAMVGAIK